jgi:hypothetical protein
MSTGGPTHFSELWAPGQNLAPVRKGPSCMPHLNSGLHAPGPRPRVALVGDAVTAAYIHEISRPQAEMSSPPRARTPRARAVRSARSPAAVPRRPGSASSDLRRGPRRHPAARRSGQIQAELV